MAKITIRLQWIEFCIKVGKIFRQSHRSQSIYAFQIDYRYWTLWDYDKNDGAKPKHRALHTANIMGNYMVIFGGNTHEHNSHEKCYDNGIYYYHLGCHKWVNSQEISKDFSSANSRLPAKGRIGHVTAVRDGSILIISGGYSGIVLSDLIGYKVPGSIALNTISHLPACHMHSIKSQCLDDPDCAWCRKKYADSRAGCLAFDEKELCENGFQTGDCPGLCSVLKECYACMAWQHGDTRLSDTPQHVVINQQCGWCVEDRKCYPKNAPLGYCGDMSTYMVCNT
ncbi:multiple epidermal growth factor-like domains protein 8 [Saccoglossus kowalevskii]